MTNKQTKTIKLSKGETRVYQELIDLMKQLNKGETKIYVSK